MHIMYVFIFFHYKFDKLFSQVKESTIFTISCVNMMLKYQSTAMFSMIHLLADILN